MFPASDGTKKTRLSAPSVHYQVLDKESLNSTLLRIRISVLEDIHLESIQFVFSAEISQALQMVDELTLFDETEVEDACDEKKASDITECLRISQEDAIEEYQSSSIKIVSATGSSQARLDKNTVFIFQIKFNQTVSFQEIQHRITVTEILSSVVSQQRTLQKKYLSLGHQVPKEEKFSALSATRFVTPILSAPRLSYVFTNPQPLSVSAIKAELVLRISARDVVVNLQKIQVRLPVKNQSIVAVGGQCSVMPITSISPIALASFAAPTIDPSTGIITLTTQKMSLIKPGDVFELHIFIPQVDATPGVSKISVIETSLDSDNMVQVRSTQLWMNKFPQGFSLSNFNVSSSFATSSLSNNAVEIYAGQSVTLSWSAQISQQLNIILYLLSSENDQPTDVTKRGNKQGVYQATMLPTTEEGNVFYSLMAILLNIDNTAWLKQDFYLPAPIVILKPVIATLSLDSSQVIADSTAATEETQKVAVGATVVLSWTIKGEFDYYKLTFNDGRDSIRLPKESFSYSDTPRCSVAYELSGYLDQDTAVLSTRTIAVDVSHPQYTYPACALQNAGFPFVQVSPDKRTIYAANEQWIKVLKIEENQNIVSQSARMLSLNAGITAMVLSPTGKLYIASKNAPSILVINTADNKILTTLKLLMLPEALLFNADGSTLYVAGNATIISICIDNHQITQPTISPLSSGAYSFQRISALALSMNQLFVASINADVIAVVDATTLTLENLLTINIDHESSSTPSDRSIYKPRSLAVTSAENDEATLFVTLAGIDSIISMTTTPSAVPATVLLGPSTSYQNSLFPLLQNPEALLLTGKNQSLLCVATGFKNSVIVYDIIHKAIVANIAVGLYSSSLTQSSDGLNVWVVCSQSLYSFWTKETPVPNQAFPNNTPIISSITSTHASSIEEFPSHSAGIDNDTLPPILRIENDINAEVSKTELAFFMPDLMSSEDIIQTSGSVLFGFFIPPLIPHVTEEEAKILKKHVKIEYTCLCIPNSPSVLKFEENAKRFELTLKRRWSEDKLKFKQRVTEVMTILKKIAIIVGLVVLNKLGHGTTIALIAKEANDMEVLGRKLKELTDLPIANTVSKPAAPSG